MSRGPGRLERAIAHVFNSEPDNAFTTEDLCRRVYQVEQVEKKHRVAVLRAARNLLRRRDALSEFAGGNRGRSSVFFDCTNVMSYAMARLKCRNGRCSDDQELRDRLAGREAALVASGGAWWGHVQSWVAELDARRAGDVKRLEKVLRKRENEEKALRIRMLIALGGGSR